MSTTEQLLAQYEGTVVPRSFNAGFVALSYVVSLIGAASTLELINRRTARTGLFNHLILFSAAVTMGGIAIWCMHFIGNRAIDLADGEAELQIAYSSGFTALSFFIPIMVLLAAFLAVGTNNRVSWWRIIIGGSLAGTAICGMHYLGNASIDNYGCIYSPINVVGSALIAVAASIVALSLFFVFRASWTNSWWRRGLSAIVLAGAVSGMHWCASTGTNYRLIRLNSGAEQISRNTTVIVVICLSVGAALIIAGTVIYTTHVMRRYAHKAQQVVLAAAVFDKNGRILVNPDGLLPSEKITDSYLEKTPSDMFSIAHPLFHWMFQASRNWGSLASIINGMSNHLAQLPRNGKDASVRLVDDKGELVQDYDVIFRELFCLAAANLANKLKEHITNAGILWDEILPTGAGVTLNRRAQSEFEKDSRLGSPSTIGNADILAEKGDGWRARQQEYGRGSLMFLVRRLENSRDVERLQAAGFRFAEVNQVAGIISSGMQIKSRNLSTKLSNMAAYAEENLLMEPGVHLSFFGLMARVGGLGFDVLVQRGTRNLLPSMPMPLDHLESWQMDFIRRLDRFNVPALCQELDAMKKLSPREMLFASQLYDTVEALRAWIDDPIFDEAILTSKVVQVPCRPQPGSTSSATCTVIALRMVIPIHVNVQSPKCEFIPLSLFKVHQMAYKDSPHYGNFSQSVHREIAPIVNAAPLTAPSATYQRGKRSILNIGLSRPKTAMYPVDGDGNPIPTKLSRKSTGSNHSGSTLKLWSGSSNDTPASDTASLRPPARRTETPAPGNFGGIMISQEIKVDVRDVADADSEGSDRYPSGSPRRSDRPASGSNVERVTVVTTGHRKGNASSAGIEMKPVSSDSRDGVHRGPMPGSATVESDRAGEVYTFVDELFTVCVDER
ncbi:hypothetical protein BX600DRAFT_506340 [Xylariales sp. PMI_506]|nr:hypothetical protein BX600DRAFT_506340 [Xylariales sp. PMI_506]